MKWITKTSMALVYAFVAAVSLVAVNTALAAPDQAAANPSKTKLSTVQSITIAGDGAASQLVVSLSSPATYTSYKTTSPLRLVVDISQTSPGSVASPITINKGNFKTVSTNRFDTDAGVLTRIYIDLNSDAEAVITASKEKPGELVVAFPSFTSPAPVVSEAKPSAPAVETTSKTDSTTSPSSAAAAGPRALTDVTVRNNTVFIAIRGGAADFKSFRLNKPERFVIDVPGATSILSTRIVPLNVAGVASARIGLYPDKIRIVLDSVNGSFPEATASSTSGGVVVSLGGRQGDNPNTKYVAAQSAKVPVVQSKNPEKTVVKPSLAPARRSGATPSSVESVDFQVLDGITRVSVKISGEPSIEPPAKTPGYVTLTVKNATIAKHLQRTLDAHSFVSPVLRVTPIVVKNKKGSDVKIRIAMRVDASHNFKQDGDTLFVDFTNPPDMPAVKTSLDSRSSARRSQKDDDIGTELVTGTDTIKASSSTAKVYRGRKVTLEFADAEVRKIFQLLSEVSGKNFVLGDEVTGTISLKLVNVPWDQALDIIMDTKNLDMRDTGNVLTIKGKGKFKTQAEEDLEIKKIAAKSIVLKTETFSVNYASVADITSQFDKLKTPDRGQISPDPRTNKIIVRDTPQAIDEMRNLLKQLDLPERQVMIEARIVQADSTFTQSLGVNWGFHATDPSGMLWGIRDANMGFGGLPSKSGSMTPSVGSDKGGSMGISFGSIFGSSASIDMRLNAAASAGMVKIISSPKVATLNNKTAKISQGQQIPYQNTSSTTGTVTQFIAATLSLEVTPHINANGTIGMKIEAKNDAATDTGTPPAINTKQASTELLLRDGETTVIGGIYVDTESSSDDGVPFLMDVPLLGNLFKSNSKLKQKSELLIFITPKILTSI